MKTQMRTALVGTLAMAIAGFGLSTTAQALVANTAPEWVTLEVSPSPVDEGQLMTVHGIFTDPDVDDSHMLTIVWGNGVAMTTTGLPFGAREFWISNTYKDDKPSGTPQDTFTLTATVSDGFNDVAATVPVTVRNVAPTVGLALSSSVILDHESVAASGSFTDPSPRDTFVATLDWGDGSAPWTHSYLATDARTFDAGTHAYPVPGTYLVTAKVTDDDTGVGTAQSSLLVQSRNRTPTDLVLSADTVVEGDPATLSGTFSDLDTTDTHTVSVDFGDGSSTTLSLAANVLSFSTLHVYVTNGAYTANVTVTDPANATVSGSVAVTVLVRNHAPADLALSVSPSVEGIAATLSASFSDPDAGDTHTAVVDWGDGSAQSSFSLGVGVLAFAPLHAYSIAGTYTVNVRVADAAGLSVSGSTAAVVARVHHAPTDLVLSVTGAVDGGSSTLTGTFTDLDAADTHTVAIDWADGSSTTLALTAGTGSFSASHTYPGAGSYTLFVTVTDPDGFAVAGTVVATVSARTTGQLLQDLTALIKSWSLDAGTENSLLTKVKDSCLSLSALANEVSAQSGKKLSADQVSAFNTLLAKASSSLSCTGSATPVVRNATPTDKSAATKEKGKSH